MPNSLKERRPLSPHLQVYRIQITSLLSIVHRGTGIVLYGAAVLLAIWFITLAQGAEPYEKMQTCLFHPIGLIVLLGISFSFFYHLCNGLRHLCWDAGHGYEISTVRKTGWTVVIVSILLTGMAWIWGGFFSHGI